MLDLKMLGKQKAPLCSNQRQSFKRRDLQTRPTLQLSPLPTFSQEELSLVNETLIRRDTRNVGTRQNLHTATALIGAGTTGRRNSQL